MLNEHAEIMLICLFSLHSVYWSRLAVTLTHTVNRLKESTTMHSVYKCITMKSKSKTPLHTGTSTCHLCIALHNMCRLAVLMHSASQAWWGAGRRRRGGVAVPPPPTVTSCGTEEEEEEEPGVPYPTLEDQVGTESVWRYAGRLGKVFPALPCPGHWSGKTSGSLHGLTDCDLVTAAAFVGEEWTQRGESFSFSGTVSGGMSGHVHQAAGRARTAPCLFRFPCCCSELDIKLKTSTFRVDWS